jgi:hypothetical protein
VLRTIVEPGTGGAQSNPARSYTRWENLRWKHPGDRPKRHAVNCGEDVKQAAIVQQQDLDWKKNSRNGRVASRRMSIPDGVVLPGLLLAECQITIERKHTYKSCDAQVQKGESKRAV